MLDKTDNSGYVVPPGAPAGGGGPGGFTSRLPHGTPTVAALHAHTGPRPLADREPLLNLASVVDAAQCFVEARDKAIEYSPHAISEETGWSVGELVQGVVPGIVTTVVLVAVPITFGGAVGDAVASLLKGAADTAGETHSGADLGLVALSGLGIPSSIQGIAPKVTPVHGLFLKGLATVSDARGRDAFIRSARIDDGARQLAQAVGAMFRLTLEAFVVYLLTEGEARVRGRAEKLWEELRKSNLDRSFLEWVRRNGGALTRDPKLNPKLRPAGENAWGAE
jgi:hypothetical protein